MGLGHAEEGVEHPGQVAVEHQRRDPRLVGLKGDGDDIRHELHVLAQILRQAVGRTAHRRKRPAPVRGIPCGTGLIGAHAVDALLHVAHARQVLLELALIVGAEQRLEARGIVAHPVEDALQPPAAAVLEQAVERQ